MRPQVDSGKQRTQRPAHNEQRYMKPVATLVMLMVLTPAAAAPIPAVKSAQCPFGYMQSGGYCTPMFRVAPSAVPKVGRCSYCAEMRLRRLGPYGY
jgi:hypothetical protein